MIALFCHKIFLTNSAKYIVHVAFLLCLLATDVNIIHRDYYGRGQEKIWLITRRTGTKTKNPAGGEVFSATVAGGSRKAHCVTSTL
ncbi:hypothetical protein AUN05_15540 [Cronobacter sakazakii]|nr:hypothetical protein AUN05_15540 [Cronobacter sakazakii]